MGCGASSRVKDEPNFPLVEERRTSAEQRRDEAFRNDYATQRHKSIKDHTLQENLVNQDTVHNIRDFYDLGADDKKAVLGRGMAGQVRRITRKSDGRKFALKTIRLSSMSKTEQSTILSEIALLRKLDHPHIAKLYETYVEEGMSIHMVIELCNGGELFDRLMSKGKFNESYAANLVGQMLKTLSYLHSINVVHRDLKLENWLFRAQETSSSSGFASLRAQGSSLRKMIMRGGSSKDEIKRKTSLEQKLLPDTDSLVLIDFGLSRGLAYEDEHMWGRVGTNYYIAPEVLKGNYTSACDMWSLGVITYMILSGRAPFSGSTDADILKSVQRAEYHFPSSGWGKISEDAKDFVRQCLQLNADKRMTSESALFHPWISKEAVKHPDHEMDTTMFRNMKKFRKFHGLKRLAIEIVAFSLKHEDIRELEQVFEDMAVGGDGFVSFEELRVALNRRGMTNDDEIHQIFEAMDEESTGRIHLTEFVAATMQEKFYQDENALHMAFHRMDSENTGFITFDSIRELLGTCTSEGRAAAMITDAKLDGLEQDEEQKISYHEFLRFMRNDGEESVKKYSHKRVSTCSELSVQDEKDASRKRSINGVKGLSIPGYEDS